MMTYSELVEQWKLRNVWNNMFYGNAKWSGDYAHSPWTRRLRELQDRCNRQALEANDMPILGLIASE